MRLLITFASIYPSRSAIMVLALLFAGIMEGVGLSMLLPMLGMAVDQHSDSGQIAAANSTLERLVVDGFETLGISPTVEILLLVLIAAITLKSALILLAKKQVGYTVAQVATDLRLELLRALLASRWQYFVKQPLGSLANSMATETGRAASAYMHGVIMTADFFRAIVYGLIAILVSWKISIIALTAGLIIFYVLKRFVRKARRAGVRQTELLKSLLALLTDTLQSIKPLKAMAREKGFDLLLEKKTNRLNKALQKQVMNKEILKAFQEQLVTIFLALGLFAMLLHWRMQLASVMVLIFLTARLLKQLGKVQERYQEMMIYESGYWSLKNIIQTMKHEREVLTGHRMPLMNREIRMENVTFSYGDQPVLQDITLVFPAGRITAIIGPSGSGKTTIVDLVSGLLRPQQGEVWIDDVPLAQVDLRSWRRMIGYVPQENILLHDTVLNNVTLGDPKLSEKNAKDALRAAGAWEFIKSLPQGMHSIVGERGGKLSGGQRQRIAIARAIVHKPKLLILDEPTSALDPQSEAAICETLGHLRGEHTILVISHQMALGELAENTYRVKDGKIVMINDRSSIGLHNKKKDEKGFHKHQCVVKPAKLP